MVAKKPTRPVAASQYDNTTPSGAAADEILKQYGDLTPSVLRIMNAGLTELGQMHAIEAFRTALTTPGDSMRDPRNAIAAGRSLDGSPEPTP
jgi:hypothetical protein